MDVKRKTQLCRLPVIDMRATGRNIDRLRRAAGLSVRQLQELYGFSTPQAIYKWQRGAALPSLDNLAVLACVLGVPMEGILVFCGDETGRREYDGEGA